MSDPSPQPGAAEQARTVVALTSVCALATLTGDGDPWASLVTYGALADGAPVLCVSRLAEHGRNLAGDARASVVVTQLDGPPDPLAGARVTLAGWAQRPADPPALAQAPPRPTRRPPLIRWRSAPPRRSRTSTRIMPTPCC